eukprot:1103171-Pleurochrysis_carterae.AAC.1
MHAEARPLRLRYHFRQLLGVAKAVRVAIRFPRDRHPQPLLRELPRAAQQVSHLRPRAGGRVQCRRCGVAVPHGYDRA